MAKSPVRSGLSTGITFSVIIIFLALIGFMETAADLIAKILGNPTQGNQMPSAIYLVIFLFLMGLWGGASAAKPDLGQKGLISSLIAGSITGLFSAIIVLIFGYLLDHNIDPRAYFNEVSPDTMELYLFNLPAFQAAVVHFLLFLASGFLGGLLAIYLRKLHLRKSVGGWISSMSNRFQNIPAVAAARRSPITFYVIFFLVAILLFLIPRQVGSYWNYILGTVGLYIILGLGLNIIVGLAGQLVLGYVAFFAIGAYSVALLTAAKPHNLNWNFWIALAIGIILSALVGILLGLPILRLRGDYLAIVTLGFAEIIRIMLRSDLLTWLTAGPKGVRNVGGPTILGKEINSDTGMLYLIIIAVLIIIFITYRLQNSRAGRAWVAIREDEIAAKATGINTYQSKLLALAIGAGYAGLAGALFASRNQFTGPEDHSLMVSINVLAEIIVGGLGSIPGTILGAFALKGLPEILRELENYRLLAFGALLVVMMILRPEGLWPAKRPNLENKITPEAIQTEKEEPFQAVKVEGD